MNRTEFLGYIFPSFIPLISGLLYFKFGVEIAVASMVFLLFVVIKIPLSLKIYCTRKNYVARYIIVNIALILCMIVAIYIPNYAIGFRLLWLIIALVTMAPFIERIEDVKKNNESKK